ncbi:hypothetical protein NP493_928g01037 [Ridgeia piscesae]|uniref:Uncharacterized protein n=1 Tax=Ridgeia piscesae TaxID=27915 RepID=A0AAD9KJZ5_RIDPI|nr:hypothetical protein NP493_928g01037 [Ridgeia piscesae]
MPCTNSPIGCSFGRLTTPSASYLAHAWRQSARGLRATSDSSFRRGSPMRLGRDEDEPRFRPQTRR